jgi:hypothetical protein
MAMRHLGRYRDVTVEQARIDGLIVKNLFRRGKLGLGILAAKVRCLMDEPRFKESLARLEAWGLVEVVPLYFGGSRQAELTATGKEFGLDITAEAQEKEFLAGDAEFRERAAAKREAEGL